MLYPLKFNPILKEMIWGGNKIPHNLNIQIDDDKKIGEDYVISGLKKDLSVVSNGSLKGKNMEELIIEFKEKLLGNDIYNQYGTKFPLLIKFIDANDDLSIQVHPDDKLAMKKHNSAGKTEMWYIMDTEEDAGLISGFSRKTDAAEFEVYHNSKRLMELMRQNPTKEGDVFFIPAGKVHSIGKGNLVAEIQQTSDITYRIYDFDRKDKNGNSRELHHELAMDAMNFTDDSSGKIDYKPETNASVNIAQCRYFTTNILDISGEKNKDFTSLDSFVIYINVKGSCAISTSGSEVILNAMEAVLIPAVTDSVKITSDEGARLLEVYIE